ncbi:MAG: hypothetical protein L6R38_005890 [Xanthoria sp. 2 TBL-2021]|nr:MAG: hypothetical protein L6R38_005890 [Xanthoria sp. 2 TBL-2021]
MQLLSLSRSLPLLTLSWLFSPNLAAILPIIGPHSAESNADSLESRAEESTDLEPRAFRLNPGSRIGAGPKYIDPFPYRIPGTSQTIIFSKWGDELPDFDDVISALDKAEADLELELKNRGYDDFIGKIRGWNFESAHIVIRNDMGSDGMNHRQLLSFLNGLRLFGQQYGFWKCDMELYDANQKLETLERRIDESATHMFSIP